MSGIKNIIFDLGGVIINLDTPRTIAAFDALSPHLPFESIYTQLHQTDLFDNFDKGLIREDEFFGTLEEFLQTGIDRQVLVNAWNTMLLDFPKHRLDMLLELKTKYRLFLLSNTNETHVREFERHLYESHGYKNLEPFFEIVYYSNLMGMRKPNADIFNTVLHQNGLNPKETLFIDDTQKHVDGAIVCGIQAHLLPFGTDVTDLIKKLL